MSKSTNGERDAKGRFAKGNQGGPGRPKRAVERDCFAKLTTHCSPTQWGKIVDKAVEQALAGDHRARTWLSQYLMPDPERMREMEDEPAVFSDDSPVQELLRQIQLRQEAGKKFEHYDTSGQ